MTECLSLSRKAWQILLLCGLMMMSQLTFAWGSLGHRVVAQIAYDQLTPHAKDQVQRLNHALDDAWRTYTFSQMATWADWVNGHDVTAFASWHYIDRGYSTDKTAIAPYDQHNVVWAINQSLKVLESQRTNSFEKAMFLRFLMHFVGDVHQPLHCIDRYSVHFPQGDKGGNLFLIQDAKSNNLHRLWDGGVGYFTQFYKEYPHHERQIRSIAVQIEDRYPVAMFKQQLSVSDPKMWSQESYQLAIQYAYKIEMGTKPNNAYITQAQQVVGKQLALAGYRLGELLNRLLG